MPAYSDGYITGRPMPDFVVKEINDRDLESVYKDGSI